MIRSVSLLVVQHVLIQIYLHIIFVRGETLSAKAASPNNFVRMEGLRYLKNVA